MTDEDRLRRGQEMFKKVYGDVIPMPELTDFGKYTLTQLFAEVLTRDTMTMRDRRLLIFGALAGSGADPSLFEIHARSAVANGEIEAAELEEFCILLSYYCGLPRLSLIYAACRKIMTESKAKCGAS
jgi:4-carboxymuconolactone decarboxylase